MNKIIAERYELIDIIGQGGMADVYLANDTILNRTIAIKILRTSLAKDPIYIARFQREASAAAALSHKNIVEIYDVGEDDGMYYIVMEYVEGQDIETYLSKNPQKINDIFNQCISGFSHLEKCKILHRDIRPMNILVSNDGDLKIIDFGFGKRITQENDFDKSITLNWWCEPPHDFKDKNMILRQKFILLVNYLKKL